MKAYIAWAIDLNTGDTLHRKVTKVIVAIDKADALAQWVETLKQPGKLGEAYNPSIHHPIVLEVAKIPEIIG